MQNAHRSIEGMNSEVGNTGVVDLVGQESIVPPISRWFDYDTDAMKVRRETGQARNVGRLQVTQPDGKITVGSSADN